MKRFLLTLSVFISFMANATLVDVLGSSLEYEYVGNSEFVFHLYLVVPACTDTAYFSDPTTGLPDLSNGEEFFYQGFYDIDGACVDTAACLVNGPGSAARSRVYHFATNAFTIAAPPAGSYRAYYWTWSLARTATNLTSLSSNETVELEARMYNNGYPRSSPHAIFENPYAVRYGEAVELTQHVASTYGDSLYQALIPALGSVATPAATYSAPFTYAQPVEGFTGFDSQTGTVHSSGLGSDSSYVIKREVSAYFNGAITSSIQIDREHIGDSYLTSGTPPSLISLVSSDPNFSLSNDSVYGTAYVAMGDTFTLSASFIDGNLSDSMEFSFQGFNYNGPAFQVTPSAGSTNPSSPFNMAFDVEWAPDSSSSAGPNRLYIKVKELGCRQLFREFIIDVYTDELPVQTDTVQGCSGFDIALMPNLPAGDYTWSPRNDLSDADIQNPVLTFGTTQLYKLYNGAQLVYQVYADVFALPLPSVSNANSTLSVTNASNFNQFDWYLYDVRIDETQPALNAGTSGGVYSVKGSKEICETTSAPQAFNLPNYSSTVCHNVTQLDSAQTLQQGEFMELDFRRDAPTSAWLREILIPNLNPSAGAQLIFTVSNTAGLNYTDTAELRDDYSYVITLPEPGLGYNFLWANQATFTLTFGAIGGDIEFPVTDSYGAGQTFGFYSVTRRSSPSPFSTQSIAFVLFESNDVSISEENVINRLYPVPATDILNVELGSNEEVEWTLFSATGQETSAGRNGGSFTIDMSNLPVGVYFLQVGNHIERVLKK